MSKGPGRVMRGIYAHCPRGFLAPGYETKPGQIRSLARKVYDTREPTPAQLRAVSRAVRQLRAEVAVVHLPPVQIDETATTNRDSVACRIPTPQESIRSVAHELKWLTGGRVAWSDNPAPRYTLSERDRDRLRRLLQEALAKLG